MNNPFDKLPLSPKVKSLLPYIISIVLLLAVIVGAYVASWSSSQNTANGPVNDLGLMPQSSTWEITLDVILKIFFVFVLIYLFAAVLKWWQKKNPGQTNKRLQILETVRPSPRQTFYLVKIGGQEFLVGATDQTMNLISEIDPDFQLDMDSEREQEIKKDQPPNFYQALLDSVKPGLKMIHPQSSEEKISETSQTGIK